MKILSLTYEYPPIGGGGGVVAAALNEELSVRGDRVRVVTCRMRDLAASETVNGVEVHRTACLRRYRHFTTAPELATTLWPAYRVAAELIRQERPELIHTHFVVPSGFVAWRLAKRFRIPFVLTAHGSDIPGYNPDRFSILHTALRPLWQRITSAAAAVTSPSAYLANLIHRQCPGLHVDVIPNGFTPGSLVLSPKRNIVLVVARLFPRKGVQHFLDAVRSLARHGDWEFVVAGDGPYMDTLRTQAKALGSPVRFVGFIGREELAAYYHAARIFVFPSIRENFPMVLLEAMDAGCAIITTDAEGCHEVVGDTGIVVPAGDSDAIAQELAMLMDDPLRCERLSQLARDRSVRFYWNRVSEMYSRVFRRVLRDDSTIVRTLPALRDA